MTEKDGGPMGLAFIASEFPRNSIYDPMGNAAAFGKQTVGREGLRRD